MGLIDVIQNPETLPQLVPGERQAVYLLCLYQRQRNTRHAGYDALPGVYSLAAARAATNFRTACRLVAWLRENFRIAVAPAEQDFLQKLLAWMFDRFERTNKRLPRLHQLQDHDAVSSYFSRPVETAPPVPSRSTQDLRTLYAAIISRD